MSRSGVSSKCAVALIKTSINNPEHYEGTVGCPSKKSFFRQLQGFSQPCIKFHSGDFMGRFPSDHVEPGMGFGFQTDSYCCLARETRSETLTWRERCKMSPL